MKHGEVLQELALAERIMNHIGKGVVVQWVYLLGFLHSRIAQTCVFRVYCSQTNLYLDDCQACTCSSNPETKAMISRQCACFLSCLAQSPAWIMALCVLRVLPALLYEETQL